MDHLHSAGQWQRPDRISAAQAAGLQHQHGADPLPSRQQRVLHGLRQVGIPPPALTDPVQRLLHQLPVLLQSLLEHILLHAQRSSPKGCSSG